MRLRSNTIIFLLTLFLVVFVSALSARAQDFTINDFNVNIVINKDSSFTVKETLIVEFHRPKHGIYREIPYIYSDSSGFTAKTPLDILSVTDGSDNKLESKITWEGNIVKIRIGDPDKYITGIQKYEIFYKVEDAILFFDDHDELYWNVTGNYWQADIKKAECSVSLSGEKSKELWASCYTGRIGSKETECRFETSDNFAQFDLIKRRLSPGEGLTIAFGWDKGIVSPPSSFKKFLWMINLKQNWVFAVPVLSLIFMFNFWHIRGRDPRVKESVAVMYGPPQYYNIPLCPAEVGSLVDEKLDSRDITATIVGLAVKGYIKIEETKEEGILFDKKDYYLKKVKESDNSLALFEKELMTKIFGSLPGKMVSELKNNFYTNLDSLKKTMYSELVRKNYFSVSPETIRQVYAVSGFVTAVLTTLLLGFSAGETVGARTFAAGILTGIPMLAFSKFMPAKTRTGSSVYMDILGFQEFLNRAEKDRLIKMKDENLFSRFFPYALALDVADNWAKAFEGIYQQPPEWYVSPGGFRAFDPVSFNHSVNSAMSNLSSAMFSAPRGSGVSSGGGFSGGGSSGGGFGGGGGGSW